MARRTGTDVAQALNQLESAHEALSGVLRGLEGQERREALRACHEAGIGATELARMTSVSRQRIYELLDNSDK